MEVFHMRRRSNLLRVGVCSAVLLLVLPGCTYMRHRGEDAADMLDLGVTWSKKPAFALYYSFVPIVAIGYGSVDGSFAGLGGGSFGAMPHCEKSVGLILWGQERLGFGEFDPEEPETVNYQRLGLVGLFQGPVPGPDYMISCPHYLHLGWGGLVATPRYLQILDFVLGWTTMDICFDDGRPRGKWGAKNFFGPGPPVAAPAPVPPDEPAP